MIKPLNQLNAFFNLTQTHTICGSDQLLYLHLFNRFNKAHWAQSISVSDRELITAMRLYESSGKPAGVQTLYRSRSRLQSAGLIKFKSGKGSDCTEYELIPLTPVDTPADTPVDTPVNTPVDTPADTPANTPVGTLPPSHINNAREDVTRRKDVKTNLTTTAATARTRENSLNSEEVQQTWFQCEGQQIPGSMVYPLFEMEKMHGTEITCKAILTASQNNKENRLTLNFLRAVLEKMLKGGTKNASTSRSDTAPEEWELDIDGWFNK